MKIYQLSEMVKGWFVGRFTPSVLQTDAFEAGLKIYKSGDSEQVHFHKIATEITVIASGRVKMCGKEWGPGSIIVLSPGDITDFIAIEDTHTIVIKVPSVPDDKYVV